VQQYSINQTTGALTSLGSTTGTSAISADITCDPTGRYVYTTVPGSGNTLLDSFSINGVTGTLTFLGSTTTVNAPAGCCVDPGGRYVFVTCSAINLIRPYIINNFSTGAGTLIGNIQINSGALNVGNTTAYGNTGEIRATNNITAFFSSDARLKANVTPIANALSIVEAVGGKTFDWTDEYIASHGGEDAYFVQKSDFGVIAQDIQRVFPQAVRVRPDGTLAVDYEKLVAVAFQAIVELKARIETLEKGK
jgi:hypothetical protein